MKDIYKVLMRYTLVPVIVGVLFGLVLLFFADMIVSLHIEHHHMLAESEAQSTYE